MTAPRILVTGSSGLVGSALVEVFRSQGYETRNLDLREEDASGCGDIRDADHVRHCLQGCDGVVHLAAVSRVVTAQLYPDLCWSTNVDGLRTVVNASMTSSRRPWLVFASSREVYGQPASLPVSETCSLKPLNIYGRSKLEGERMVEATVRQGLRGCTIRLANVFGALADHKDRVIPAFARAAVEGRPLRVDGRGHTFDFTHVNDVSNGLLALTRLLLTHEATPPPPIQFVSGTPTTLGELAELVIKIAGSGSPIHDAPPKNFEVETFVGIGARARQILGWEPQVSLRAGLTQLIADIRAETDQTGAGERVA